MMNLKNALKIAIFTLCLVPLHFTAQITSSPDYLKGLTKVSLETLSTSGKPLMMDGESIPVYSPEGKRVKGMEMIQYVQGGDYFFDAYVDGKNEVKAVVFRKATSEEKKVIENFKPGKLDHDKDKSAKPAKNFKATDLMNVTYELASLKGEIVVLNFWFTKCAPCVMEMPELNKLVEKYADKNVVFLGITFDNKKELSNFLAKNKFKYAIIPEAQKIIKDYGVSSYPTHIVIDKDSNVIFKTSGLSSDTVDQVDQEIGKLLQ